MGGRGGCRMAPRMRAGIEIGLDGCPGRTGETNRRSARMIVGRYCRNDPRELVPPQSDAPPYPKTADLFGDTPAAAPYVSPFRRPEPEPTPKPARAPSPIQLTKPTASPAAIAASVAHKATGTEKYKLGQFSDAESACSSAIDALPARHLFLVPAVQQPRPCAP